MKSQWYLFLSSCLLISFISCSTDPTESNNDLAGENGFQFANQVYNTENVYISEDQVLVLSNHTLDMEGEIVDIDIARFEIGQESFDEKSYFVNDQLISCHTATGAVWDRGVIEDGTVILNEASISDGFFRIKYIDKSNQFIRLIFEFERTDGQLVAGSYEGIYRKQTFE